MSKLFTVNGINFISNIEYSKIGYAYPRIFVEAKPGEIYYSNDLTLGQLFPMKKNDWDDWASDAEKVEVAEGLEETGVSVEDMSEFATRVYDHFNQ